MSKMCLTAGAIAGAPFFSPDGAPAFGLRPWGRDNDCRLASFNTRICQTNSTRCDAMFREFGNMAVTCLQSTAQRQPFDRVDKTHLLWSFKSIGQHNVFSFGYPPGGHKSTGVVVSYHKRLFSQLDVQRVEVPRGEGIR